MTVVAATFGELSEFQLMHDIYHFKAQEPFVQSVVDFLLKLPDICDKLEAENLKMEANATCENSLLCEVISPSLLPGKVPIARMQSFVVSAINEEEVKSFSDFYDFLELPTLGKLLDSRRYPLVISCELEKGSPRLKINLNANVVGQFKPNNNAPYGNTYNSSWRNHPNFSWKAEKLKTNSRIHHLNNLQVLNKQWLISSKIVGDFVGNQEATNAQINQRIDRVESTLNKRMDGM
ncbi:hypothetical protein AAG906_015586 [Vitis piasezkii]